MSGSQPLGATCTYEAASRITLKAWRWFVSQFDKLHYCFFNAYLGFPGGLLVKNLPANSGDAGDTGLIPGLERLPGRGNGNPLQYSCWEKSHGQRSMAGYSLWSCTESDTGQTWLSDWTHTHTMHTWLSIWLKFVLETTKLVRKWGSLVSKTLKITRAMGERGKVRQGKGK